MESSSTAKIEITAPRRYTTGALLVVTAFGIFRAVPIILAILAVSMIKFGLLTLLIPLAALAATAIFIPFGLGNAYVAKLVRDMDPQAANDPNSFIVQLTLTPRIRTGVRAVFEDADDIGVLTCGASDLSFDGDSICLRVPLSQISMVRPHNPGLRGFYFYGRRIELTVTGLPNVQSLEVAERSSWLLPTSKRITKRLYEHLSKK